MVVWGAFGAFMSLFLASLRQVPNPLSSQRRLLLPRYEVTETGVVLEYPRDDGGTDPKQGGAWVRTKISSSRQPPSLGKSNRSRGARSTMAPKLSIRSWNVTSDGNDSSRNTDGNSFYGVVGIFSVPGGASRFLAVIRDAVPAEHLGEGVRRVREIGLIHIPSAPAPVATTTSSSSSSNASTYRADPQLELKERELFDTLRRTFARHSFYFSTGPYDISRTLQSNRLQPRSMHCSISSPPSTAAALSPGIDCDPRFFWNLDVARPLIEAGCGAVVTPIVNMWTQSTYLEGAQSTNNTKLRDPYTLTLIARRSRFRQGPRYSKRGIDRWGHVANFVESEQVLRSLGGNRTTAFVQIRGSVPLFWKQDRLWRLKPRLSLDSAADVDAHARALRAHLKDLDKAYIRPLAAAGEAASPVVSEIEGLTKSDASIAIVNLIDKKGPARSLGVMLSSALRRLASRPTSHVSLDALEKQLSKTDRALCTEETYRIPINSKGGNRFAGKANILGIKYLWFDQHYAIAISGGVKAMDQLMHKLKGFIGDPQCAGDVGIPHLGNCLQIDEKGNVVRLQSKIIRTNCIDCLDRTNFAQSRFAQWSLQSQLAEGRPSDPPPDEDMPMTEGDVAAFRRLWANHGDAISLLYSGTRAMKRDLTRHGRRTLGGMLQDGASFAWRYFLGNFRDAERQRGIDIVLGISNKNESTSE